MQFDFAHRTRILVLLCTFLLPCIASAHQPRLVESPSVVVTQPEISKAYYGTLTGTPHVFRITSDVPFSLYVNILVPDMRGQKTDVSVTIFKDGSTTPLYSLAAESMAWKPMWEPFGYDAYLQGPEYRLRAEAGEYEIRVFSVHNDSKYALAIGEIEQFDLPETLNTLELVPKLKRDFFQESPVTFLYSPIGAGYVIIMFALAGVFGLLYRFVLRFYARRSSESTPRAAAKNINSADRILRAIIGLALFLLAITTTWNPVLLFFAGFCLFEAVFSWCGFYAALGKSTCPIV